MTACRGAAEDGLKQRENVECETQRGWKVVTYETSLSIMSKCIFSIHHSLNSDLFPPTILQSMLLWLQWLPYSYHECTVGRKVCDKQGSFKLLSYRANSQSAPHYSVLTYQGQTQDPSSFTTLTYQDVKGIQVCSLVIQRWTETKTATPQENVPPVFNRRSPTPALHGRLVRW